MKVTKVLVKNGSIYLPTNSENMNGDGYYVTFRSGRISSIIKNLKVDEGSLEQQIPSSNRYCKVMTSEQYEKYITQDISKVFSGRNRNALLRYIGANSVRSKNNKVSIPIAYRSSYSAGEFVLLTDENGLMEIWDSTVWEKVKSVMLEQGKIIENKGIEEISSQGVSL